MSTFYQPPTATRLNAAGYSVTQPGGPLGGVSGRAGAAGVLAPATAYSPDQSLGASVGRWARRSAVPGAQRAGDVAWGHGSLLGALMTGAVGAAGGYGASKLWNLFAGPDRQISPERAALLTGLLGAGGGAYLGATHKSASAKAFRGASPADIEAAVIEALAGDAGLSDSQRAAAAGAVSKLTDAELRQLLSFLSSAGGATIGALVMRFLMGKGLIPLAIGATVGALAGGAMFGAPKNALGQRSLGPGGFFG